MCEQHLHFYTRFVGKNELTFRSFVVLFYFQKEMLCQICSSWVEFLLASIVENID